MAYFLRGGEYRVKKEKNIPANLPKPYLSIPKYTAVQVKRTSIPRKVRVYEFVATSDGRRHTYVAGDAIKSYPLSRLLNADEVSYTNLFVNGMLQPKLHYKLADGKLIFLTDDVPIKHASIVLQMIIVY